MKTRFICNVSNARLFRNRTDNGEGFEAEYVVEFFRQIDHNFDYDSQSE